MPAAGNRKVRPLQGGTRIESKKLSTLRNGTLGLVITYEGEKSFVTAGHAVFGESDFVGQPAESDMVGQVVANFLPEGVDIAVVQVLIGVAAELGRVWTGEGSSITAQFAKDTRPDKGASVFLQGAVSGAVQGTVLENDVDIIDKTTGQKESHAVLVQYAGSTAAGDSGAPVLSALADNALCYGVHGGKTDYKGGTVEWFAPFANIDWD